MFKFPKILKYFLICSLVYLINWKYQFVYYFTSEFYYNNFENFGCVTLCEDSDVVQSFLIKVLFAGGIF